MKLLAWDTSSKAGSIAALEWDEVRGSPRGGQSGLRLVSEWTLNVEATHSEKLLWAIHSVLRGTGWKLSDVDLFGVGVGPGSFTGLRIGVTTARTLAHALGKPLVGVSSLAALARPAAQWLAAWENRVIVVAATDACKGELFALWGSARSVVDCVVPRDGEREGLWKRGVEEGVLSPTELVKAVKRKMSEGGKAASSRCRWLVVGEGRKRYLDSWKTLPASQELEIPAPFPDQVQGRFVGLLAWEAFQAGLATDGLKIRPRYVRASDAERKLRAGLLPPGPSRSDPGESRE